MSFDTDGELQLLERPIVCMLNDLYSLWENIGVVQKQERDIGRVEDKALCSSL